MFYGKTGNCWDFFSCDRTIQCPAKTDITGDGKCWRVASTQTEYIPSKVNVRDGMKECWNCAFFRMRNKEFFEY